MENKQKAIIFGCGYQGRICLAMLEEKYDIIAYSDNNKNLWGTKIVGTIDGYSVVPPTEIRRLIGDNGIVVICSQQYYDEIARQLETMGVTKYCIAFNDRLLDYKSGLNINQRALYENTEVSPEILYLSLADACNLRCRYCPWHGDNPLRKPTNAFMTQEIAEEIAQQSKSVSTLKALHLAGTGEPFLNSRWLQITNKILDRTTINKTTIYTNGMLLTKNNVHQLAELHCDFIVLETSVDGTSASDLEYWRKGSKWETIKENLHYAYAFLNKDRFRFIISDCAVLPPEFNEIEDDAMIKKYYDSSCNWLREAFPQAEVVFGCATAFAGGIPGTNVRKWTDMSLKKCMNPYNMISIGANGDIFRCACLGQTEVIGNVLNVNVYELWETDESINEIRNAQKEGIVLDICERCQGMMGSRKVLVQSKNCEEAL